MSTPPERPSALNSEDEEGEPHGPGEVIAAAVVRVAAWVHPPVNLDETWPGTRAGVALQTVSAVNWLSAGRARGAA